LLLLVVDVRSGATKASVECEKSRTRQTRECEISTWWLLIAEAASAAGLVSSLPYAGTISQSDAFDNISQIPTHARTHAPALAAIKTNSTNRKDASLLDSMMLLLIARIVQVGATVL